MELENQSFYFHPDASIFLKQQKKEKNQMGMDVCDFINRAQALGINVDLRVKLNKSLVLLGYVQLQVGLS